MADPFTPDELYQAQHLLSDDAAPRRAREESRGDGGPPEMSALAGHIGFGAVYTEDTLILLSLVSPEISKKVEQYRRRGGRHISAREQQRWEQRKAELRAEIERNRPPHIEPKSPPR